MIKTTKHVDLPDGSYLGVWYNYIVTVPFTDKDLELDVNEQSPNLDGVKVCVVVNNNSATIFQ